jgi:glutaminase
MNNGIDWVTILEKTYKKCMKIKSGKNADYIPILSHVNPNLFAISVFTIDGAIYNIGDYKKEFAIESVSKLFSLALALETHGVKDVYKKIGSQKSKLVFNSVTAIEKSTIHTMNSFVNGGAMSTLSLSYVPNRASFQKRIYDTMSAFAARRLHMSKPIYKSEYNNSDQNRSIAYLLHSFGRFYAPVEPVVDVYTRHV